MTELKSDNSFLARASYQPSNKTWLWSIVGSSVATMLLGFTAGGWMTSGGADVMSTMAAREARAQLAASVCVNRFVAAEMAVIKLKQLKHVSFWQRDKFIRDGGWAEIAGQSPVPGAVELCAKQLLAMKELPPVTASEPSAGS